MFNESLSLAEEFPHFKDAIHRLKGADRHFAKLFEEYETVSKEIHRIEQEIETVSDQVAEELKKKRLMLKDQLFAQLKNAA